MRTSFLCLAPAEAATIRDALPRASEAEGAVARLAAFADPTRLRIALVLAATSELCVGDTAGLLGLPVKLVSHHARYLAERGLATRQREGKLIRYRLTDEARTLLEAAFGRPLPVEVEVGHHRAHAEAGT
jgi:DNA-binding transcriptional ArsR family regulator